MPVKQSLNDGVENIEALIIKLSPIGKSKRSQARDIEPNEWAGNVRIRVEGQN